MYAYLYRHPEYYRCQMIEITEDPTWAPEAPAVVECSGSLENPLDILSLGQLAEFDNLQAIRQCLSEGMRNES